MSESLHLVCPHCTAVNRIPRERLGEVPRCGQCKQPLFTGHPLELNSANFDRHLGRTDLPIIIDFWAPWCAPCRMMAPAFSQVCREMEPALRFAKLDTEAEPQLAARFNIRSIPTLAIFHQGREIVRQSGALDQGSLKRWVQSHALNIT